MADSNLITRTLQRSLQRQYAQYPVTFITGPRQSGKSTLAHMCFPDLNEVNLEDLQLRSAAQADSKTFLEQTKTPLIIDEAQYAPDLFSYIQVNVDKTRALGQYILTGSQNFLLVKHITQSLAGRVAILRLLPLSYQEVMQHIHRDKTVQIRNTKESSRALNVNQFILTGGYPALYDRALDRMPYFRNYINTYVERDVRALYAIKDLARFRDFLEICALNAGKLLNLSELSRDCGMALNTIKSWLSILEASYLIFLLRPYYKNSRKRLTKTPKVYFYDTGLLCYLLQIATPEQLVRSNHYGPIFENLIIAETIKNYYNQNIEPRLFFYRDDHKFEVDLLDFTNPEEPAAYEIKSSQTYHDSYARALTTICDELGITPKNRGVIMRSAFSYTKEQTSIIDVLDYLIQKPDALK